MYRYAVLRNPGHNRVYFDASKDLCIGELAVAFSHFSIGCDNIHIEKLAGTEYLFFETARPLAKDELAVLSHLSFVFAIFLLRTDSQKLLLEPIERETPYIGENMSSMLKYSGKTNELFTRMMLNLALYTSDFYNAPTIRLLDPMAGKGTTLYEGLMRGFHVYGVEIQEKMVQESCRFLKKYLETEKWKHTMKSEKVSGPERSFSAVRYQFALAKNKDEIKTSGWKEVQWIAGDTKHVRGYFRKNFFHLIAADLPYGVQHGNVSRQSSFTRNPASLVEDALKGWKEVLLPGGVIALSWNSFVLPREALSKIFADAGFLVMEEPPYCSFAHRVDQAIMRDLLIAKKDNKKPARV